MIQSKLVTKKLKEAAQKLKLRPEDIWEDLAAGYVDSIPDEKGIIADIEYYVKSYSKKI